MAKSKKTGKGAKSKWTKRNNPNHLGKSTDVEDAHSVRKPNDVRRGTDDTEHDPQGYNETTNNKFDERLKEIYKSLVIEGPIAGGAKTGMDIATKLAQDYSSKPFGTKAWHDKATGGAGKRSKGIVKKYHDVAMDAAETELDSMVTTAADAKKAAVNDAKTAKA